MPRITARARALYHALLRDDSAALAQLQSSVDDLAARLDRLQPPAGPAHDPAVAYLGDHEAVVTTSWGRRLIVRTDDYIVSPELLSTGTYERELTELIPRLLTPGGTMVDVGANIGYYSLLAATVVGAEGFVVGFEPHPATARLLQVNLVLNGMWGSSQVEVRAAHHEAAELTFYVRGRFGANSSLGPVEQAELDELGDTQERITVPAIDLDSVLDGLDRAGAVELIKVDVEGAELGVFRGAARTMRESRPRIVLEWCPGQQVRAGYAPAEFVDHLDELDLDIAVIDAGSGALTPTRSSALLETPYTNVLLTPAGEPPTIR